LDRPSFDASPPSTRQSRPEPVSRRAEPLRPPPAPSAPPSRIANGDYKLKELAKSIAHSDKTIAIETYASSASGDANRRANDRANLIRNQLIDHGVAPARIKIVNKVEPTQPERVRLVAQTARGDEARPARGGKVADADAQPVGESHFENK